MFVSLQAVWASTAKAASKNGGYCFLSDYQAVSSQIQKVPVVMPNRNAEVPQLTGAHVFGKLNMLDGYWRCRLSVKAEEGITIVTPTGLYNPCVSHGLVLNATMIFSGCSHTVFGRSGL